MALQTVSFTLHAGDSLSDVVSCLGADQIVRLIIPDAWQPAPISFQLSPDGVEFHNLYRVIPDSMIDYEVTVPTPQAGSSVTFPAGMGMLPGWVRVRSGTNGAPVVQGEDCVFTLIFDMPSASDGGTGGVGPPGPPGQAGQPGPTGPTGASGSLGPVGPIGVPGPVGDTGPVGAQGDTGPVGGPGPAGSQGVPGPIGPVGSQGAQGDPGSVGPTGPQGAIGSLGPTGPATPGPAGATGPQGLPGPSTVSADPGNQTRLGSDSLIFTPAPSLPLASTFLPAMDGTAKAGSSIAWSPGDHIHPTDTSRASVIGVVDGSNAAPGNVGEFMSAQLLSTAAVSAPTGADKTIVSLTLTPGDWSVWASVGFTMTNCTGITLKGWLNAGGMTAPSVDQLGGNAVTGPSNNTPQTIMPITPMRVNSATSTVVTLGATPTFGGASPTCNVWGKILARRTR